MGRKSQYQRVSVKFSVICAAAGLATAALLAATLFRLVGVGLHEILALPVFQKPVIVAVVMLFAAAALLGAVAGNLIYRVGSEGYGVWLIGVALAWSCLFISALAGSSVNFFAEVHDGGAFIDYLVRPMLGVMLVGGIPALVLGLVYAVGVRKSLGRS